MPEFVKAFGIAMVILGVFFAVRPSGARGLITFAKAGKRIFYGAVVRVILGLLLLASINAVTMPWAVGVFGAILLASGVLIFILGMARSQAVLDWAFLLPDKFVRVYAVFAGAIGVLLIYAA